MPARNASATYQMRSAPADFQLADQPRLVFFVVEHRQLDSDPVRPISSPRNAFWNDSWNVRPIAMTSPTDFICVVRRASFACGNFSNVKRGIFVTT